jgi:hypothetical protein
MNAKNIKGAKSVPNVEVRPGGKLGSTTSYAPIPTPSGGTVPKPSGNTAIRLSRQPSKGGK